MQSVVVAYLLYKQQLYVASSKIVYKLAMKHALWRFHFVYFFDHIKHTVILNTGFFFSIEAPKHIQLMLCYIQSFIFDRQKIRPNFIFKVYTGEQTSNATRQIE